MLISDICIRRPVFATMIITAIVVLGMFSYLQMGVDLFPKVDLPNMVITTRVPGAGPEEVESQVSKVIEEAVNTISGIDELRSVSYEGISQVVVVFKIDRDPDICAQDVRDRIGRILSKLPQGVEAPIIEKFDPDAAPILTVVVSAPRPVKELTEFARNAIKEEIETVSGVGQVTMVGGREREIHVALDADKLIAYGVTSEDVRKALIRQNVEVPGGLVETGTRDLTLRTMGRIERVEEFNQVVIHERNGILVTLADVATVSDSEQELRSLARLDGENAIALIIQKQSGMNTVEVVTLVKKKLASLATVIPKDVKLQTIRDQSRFILGSFHAVMEHLILGAILASLVVLLFLRDLRSTLIAAVAIPTSLIASFTWMDMGDITLNQMSLLAMALAVGIVIDDAIVVLENIYRHLTHEKVTPEEAASTGTREIGLAVMATTLSLVVIFVPIAFMPGVIGRFFMSFGLTMVYCIMVSMVVSFVLTPMLCAKFLKVGEKKHDEEGGWFGWMLLRPYLALLRLAMRFRWLTATLAVLTAFSTVPLMKIVGHDFIPIDDQSECLVLVEAKQGTSIQSMTKHLDAIEKDLQALPEINALLTTVGDAPGAGVHEGTIYVQFTDVSLRKRSQFDLMGVIRDMLKEKHPDLLGKVQIVPAISGGGFKQVDLQLTVQGPDLEVLRKYTDEITALMKGIKGIVDLDTTLNEGKPELRVNVDRVRAASMGVDLMEVASTLRTFVGGDEELVTKYRDRSRGEEYEVRVRLRDSYRNEPQDILDLPVHTKNGKLVPLRAIADVVVGVSPTQIDRYNRQRQVSIESNLQGLPLGNAQKLIDEKLRTMDFAPGYTYGYLGRSKVMKEQNYGFLLAFIMSTLFVYMILAAQFESFLHPVTILSSLPLCIPFGVLSLVVASERMQLYSTLGLFMLFGIVKKNSILQVDYTNVLREQGMERDAAIMESNRTRLRPILMTTLTLIVGMIPTAMGTGPGSGSRRSMAIVVIGGQTLCLLITLLVTPVVYTFLDDLSSSRFARKMRGWIFATPQ